MFGKKYTIATHKGEFHADDVFAVATLALLLDNSVKVIRTRDESQIEKADYVVDVGGIHDVAKNRFDHHQAGGAGVRDNRIPYAAFGLVWKAFGEKLSGSKVAAGFVEEKLVMPLDAGDNGVSVSSQLFPGVNPYQIQSAIGAFRPTWKETDADIDATFLEMVEFAKKVLAREIKRAQGKEEAQSLVEAAYQAAPDKRFVVLDAPYPWHDAIEEYNQVLYVVQPKLAGDWRVYAVRKDKSGFANKKDLPREWAGKKDAELVEVTGVEGARFCHNNLFMAATTSKEAAIKLAEIAVKS